MHAIGGKLVGWLPGLACPLRRLTTGGAVQFVHWRDHPAHDEAWADRESAAYGGRDSPYWRQNYEGELLRGGQPVWPYLLPDVHIRTIPRQEYLSADWTLYRGLDHGIRHPECCAWAAVNRAGDLYVYRQYYATDRTIALNAKAVLEATPPDERVAFTVADPSIWQRDAQTLQVWSSVYRENGLELTKADNSGVGYETVTAMLVASLAQHCLWRNDLERLRTALHAPSLTLGDAARLAAHPKLWFAPTVNTGPMSIFDELKNFRWQTANSNPEKAAPQRYVDVNDEGVDVVRYLAQTRNVVCFRAGSQVPRDDLLLRIMECGTQATGGR